jgi:hypothetical protein
VLGRGVVTIVRIAVTDSIKLVIVVIVLLILVSSCHMRRLLIILLLLEPIAGIILVVFVAQLQVAQHVVTRSAGRVALALRSLGLGSRRRRILIIVANVLVIVVAVVGGALAPVRNVGDAHVGGARGGGALPCSCAAHLGQHSQRR